MSGILGKWPTLGHVLTHLLTMSPCLVFQCRNISPVESLPVALAAFGEGWHNFHHVFPWDYKTSEFGDYKYNMSTGFIDFFAKIGWAYARKWRCH